MADVTLGVKYKDGATYSATGFIDIESWSSADAKMTLKLIPRGLKGFELVAAGSGDMSGTPKKVSIAGVTYNVLADSDFSHVPSGYKNEAVPHSGGNMRKMTLQAKEIGSVTITCNANEYAALKAIAEG